MKSHHDQQKQYRRNILYCDIMLWICRIIGGGAILRLIYLIFKYEF